MDVNNKCAWKDPCKKTKGTLSVVDWRL